MKASSLKDMPVVSMTDGSKVGSVQDVLFETSGLLVKALALSGASGQSTLPFEHIRTIGDDAIIIEQANVVQGATGQSGVEGLRGLSQLLDLNVVNSDGALLGQLKEIEIEPRDGRLLQLVVHSGGVLGIGGSTTTVTPAALRGVGADLITVEAPAAAAEQAADA